MHSRSAPRMANSSRPGHRGDDLVPTRLRNELSLSTVKYGEDGLIVHFSSLEPSEILQIQFVVAWAGEHTDESPATWFAVDQAPTWLLQQLIANE